MKYLTLIASAVFGLSASLTVHASTNLVVNPGFEGGNVGDDPNGWTLVPAPSGHSSNVGGAPHFGQHAYEFGAEGLTQDFISQAISTTIGDQYQISYWLQTSGGDFGGDPNHEEFSAVFGTFGLQDLSPLTSFSYTKFTFLETANATSSTLTFGGKSEEGLYQLDDVSVVDLTTAGGTNNVPDPGIGIAGIAAVFLGLCVVSARFGSIGAPRRIALRS